MTGGCDHGIVDADHRQRADGPALGAKLVELGDLFLERTTCERHAEGGLLECRAAAVDGLLFAQPRGARVLLLLVAPDAVVRLVERADEVGAAVGERETLAASRMAFVQAQAFDAVARFALDGNEAHVVELARRLEKHARLVQRPASAVCAAHAA